MHIEIDPKPASRQFQVDLAQIALWPATAYRFCGLNCGLKNVRKSAIFDPPPLPRFPLTVRIRPDSDDPTSADTCGPSRPIGVNEH